MQIFINSNGVVKVTPEWGQGHAILQYPVLIDLELELSDGMHLQLINI
jgi:hypothetical protein